MCESGRKINFWQREFLVGALSLRQSLRSLARSSTGLHKQHWVIETCSNPIEDVKGADDVVLVVDELFDSIVDRFDEKQFEIIKTMVERRCTVLWVTAGGQLKVTDPNKAAVVGLFRTIRAEEQVKLAMKE